MHGFVSADLQQCYANRYIIFVFLMVCNTNNYIRSNKQINAFTMQAYCKLRLN